MHTLGKTEPDWDDKYIEKCIDEFTTLTDEEFENLKKILHYDDNTRYSDSVISARRRCVRCTTTGIVYSSVTEASHALGISRNSIIDVCKGVKKTSCGLEFEYVEVEQ